MKKYSKEQIYFLTLSIFFLLGIFLRTKGLFANPSLWHDECALGWNINFKGFMDYFGLLRFMQMAPPFFMIVTKFITNLFGISDFTLRVLPFLFGAASIFLFYPLCSVLFKNKVSVLTAVLLFSINFILINYSFEFKPYSADVFFTIACILFFIKLDIEKISAKSALTYGFLLALVPWFSFTSMFVIAAGILNLATKKFQDKRLILMILPLFLGGLLYLKIYLLNNYTDTNMVKYWSESFVTGDLRQFLILFITNLKYFFFPVNNILFVFVFLIFGWYFFKREKSDFAYISLFTLCGLILASYMRLYPFSQRLIVFLIPIFILLIAKVFDFISKDKKALSIVIIFLFSTTFYPQILYVRDFWMLDSLNRGENPRIVMELMASEIKKGDYIFVTKDSNTEFYYYSSFKDFKNNIIQEKHLTDGNEDLNSIPKNKNCWFYLVHGNQEKYLNWIEKHTKVLKILGDKKKNSLVIYTHVK